MKRWLFFLVASGLLMRCTPPAVPPVSVTPAQLHGNWVCQTLVDWACERGMHWDTSGYWYVTELSYDSHIPDSIFWINQDLETARLALSIHGDSIWLVEATHADSTLLRYDAANDQLILDDPALKQLYRFKKAEKDWLEYNGTYSTAFKHVLRHCLLSGNYRETGGLNMMSLTNDGGIKSWQLYNRYDLFINGDLAGFANEPVLLMGKDSLSDLYLWELQQDTLRLFAPVLMTAPGEKPFYKKGKRIFEFRKETRSTLP